MISRFFPTASAVLTELGALAIAGPMTLCLQALRPWKPTPGAARSRPVLLIHGYAGNQTVWTRAWYKLRREPLGPIYMWNACTLGKSIEEDLAPKLLELIRHIQKETQCEELDIVGHSLGGLLGAYYAESLRTESDPRVRKMILVGSPLHGSTFLPWFVVDETRRSLFPGTEFLQQLRESMVHTRSADYHCLASRDDPVAKPDSAILPPLPHTYFGGQGHVALLFHRPCIEKICALLQE